MEIDVIVAEVAAAVGLAEGEAGVRDVIRVIARSEPIATSQISREAELPVPLVTAVCNELRKRGVVDKTRPVRLTAAARELTSRTRVDVVCACCAGLGLAVPASLGGLAQELERIAAGAPQARPDLDQTHCTVATKIHRVLRLQEAGALDGRDVLLLGDDDLVAVAIDRFARLTGVAASVTVVDSDPAVLSWIGEQTQGSGIRLVEHDLRQPLPDDLAGAFDVVCTDPPYTVPGAELFLSRAVSALRPRPGGHVFFSFGARRPAETLATQRLIAGLGLVLRSLTPNFNSYVGAGILAGTSHLYHLRSAELVAELDGDQLVVGEYTGPLYTAQTRGDRVRPYRCAKCAAVHEVGAAPWGTIGELKAAGCPSCGGDVSGRCREANRSAGAAGNAVLAWRVRAWRVRAWRVRACARMLRVAGQSGRHQIRPASESDLDALAAFEVEIAMVSFGDEAITDPAFHRRRIAGSLGKPGEIALVAVAGDARDRPVGWAWMSGRANSLTGARYGNFRSLAVADIADRGAVGELLMAAILRRPTRRDSPTCPGRSTPRTWACAPFTARSASPRRI